MIAADRFETIRKITKNVKSIPTLPEVMSKLIEIVGDPNTSAPQLARFISNDAVLTAKILKLANSAFYGFPQRIGTINLAIVVLGFQSVKDLALSAYVVEMFTRDEYKTYFDPIRFWVHAIASAAGCKIISRESNFKASGEIFITGLLHDIGMLVLSHNYKDQYRSVFEYRKEHGICLYDAEIDTLGFSHADVGGWILESWNLPEHQVAAVYDYPFPWLSTKQPNLSMLVHFSDILARREGYSVLATEEDVDFQPEMHPKVASYLNLKNNNEGEVDWTFYHDLLQKEMIQAKEFLAVLINES